MCLATHKQLVHAQAPCIILDVARQDHLRGRRSYRSSARQSSSCSIDFFACTATVRRQQADKSFVRRQNAYANVKCMQNGVESTSFVRLYVAQSFRVHVTSCTPSDWSQQRMRTSRIRDTGYKTHNDRLSLEQTQEALDQVWAVLDPDFKFPCRKQKLAGLGFADQESVFS